MFVIFVWGRNNLVGKLDVPLYRLEKLVAGRYLRGYPTTLILIQLFRGKKMETGFCVRKAYVCVVVSTN
jgi:hypothetical protein